MQGQAQPCPQDHSGEAQGQGQQLPGEGSRPCNEAGHSLPPLLLCPADPPPCLPAAPPAAPAAPGTQQPAPSWCTEKPVSHSRFLSLNAALLLSWGIPAPQRAFPKSVCLCWPGHSCTPALCSPQGPSLLCRVSELWGHGVAPDSALAMLVRAGIRPSWTGITTTDTAGTCLCSWKVLRVTPGHLQWQEMCLGGH